MESGTPPSAGFYNFLGWLETNRQRVAIGLVVLVGLGLIAGFIAWRSGQTEIEAEQALSAVRMPFVPTETPAAGTAETLVKVADEYPKTLAAAKALLRAGTVYFDQGNFTKAQEQFDKFLRNHDKTSWVPQAVFGIAACLDAQNKTAEAISKYNDFIKNYPSDPAADQARLNLARLYERSNQPALALDVLKKLTEQGPQTQAAGEAQERMRELFAKHPSLVPPNPVTSPNVFTNVVRPQTNMVNLTNLLQRTEPPSSANTNAPRILPAPGTNTGK
jgi:predicted negative regulator of RcsB-dependent stress response